MIKKRKVKMLEKQQEGFEFEAQEKMSQLDKVKLTLIYIE